MQNGEWKIEIHAAAYIYYIMIDTFEKIFAE